MSKIHLTWYRVTWSEFEILAKRGFNFEGYLDLSDYKNTGSVWVLSENFPLNEAKNGELK